MDIPANKARLRARLGFVFAVIGALVPFALVVQQLICGWREQCEWSFGWLAVVGFFALLALWSAAMARSTALSITAGQYEGAWNKARSVASFLMVPVIFLGAISILAGIAGLLTWMDPPPPSTGKFDLGPALYEFVVVALLGASGVLATYWIPLGLTVFMLRASARALELAQTAEESPRHPIS